MWSGLGWVAHSPTEPKTTLYRAGCSRVKSDCRNVHGFYVTLGLVAHTKYHPSYIKHAGKVCCDLVLDLKWGQGHIERYVAHLQWLYHWLAPSTCMCKYVKRFGLSRAHKVPPVFGRDAWTHRCTHRHESYVPRLGHSHHGGKQSHWLSSKRIFAMKGWFSIIQVNYPWHTCNRV